MQHFGKVKPGSTLYIYFHTFDSNDPSASVTITGLAVTDIEVYKDGSVTQRASDAGYTLLDTDGIDFDALTGIHGFSIDLADNTTANFWEAGSHYVVVVSAITVDAATVSFVAADFTIGYEGAVLDTTIATLASQTSFTLEDGSADNDAYNGCVAVIHDLASAIQVAIGYVSDYTGATKTITLDADPAIFTMAAGDNISLFPPVSVGGWRGQVPADLTAADHVQANTQALATGVIDSGTFSTNAINAAALAADAAQEIRDAIVTFQIADAVPADGTRPTIQQALLMIVSMLTEFAISSTTLTVFKEDGTTSRMTFTLDDGTNPTSLTRAT